MKIHFSTATKKQQEYIEQLCIDLGISHRLERNAHCSSIIGRQIKYLDELSSTDASEIINTLKRWKEDAKQRSNPST